MVRATLWVVSVGFFVGATACSGRSTKDDDSSGGKSGDAGSSGFETGGSGGTSSGSGGTSQGGTTSGDDGDDDNGGTIAGSASGGSSGAFPTGGTAPTGGAPTGGTAGSSTGGAAGEGGSAGEPSECEGPAPGGCQRSGCAEGQTCQLASGTCIPSVCSCSNGTWVCTGDCGGGRCVDGPGACTTPDPSGCLTNDDCASDEECKQPAITVCIPTGCACSPLGNTWQCANPCNGGVCVPKTPDECPETCEPQASGVCGSDKATWVCTSSPIPVQDFMNGGCTDAFTQVPRYCCPPTFKPECQ